MPDSTCSTPLPSRIASLVHDHFDALPNRSKPTIFPDGSREWIPMTGIVAVKGEDTPSESLHCISITSGAKCLSASQMQRCRGLVLHDCHAEILAIRAFNYWLLTECQGLMAEDRSTSNPSSSSFIQRRAKNECNTSSESSIDWPPFEFQRDVKLYMYCTCAPCGDGSMELCMASQEDATPWEVVRKTKQDPETQEGPTLVDDDLLDGRAHFSLLGVVRRKPSRTDAESTRSKSCSDKLALKQVSSLLSWQTSHLVAPTKNAYLAGLILPEDEISRIACERSFGENGRMKALRERHWTGETTDDTVGYRFHPFQVLSVPAEEIQALWRFAKPKSITQTSSPPKDHTLATETQALPKKSKPGNVSGVWAAAPSSSHMNTMKLSETGSKQLPSLVKSTTGLYETIIGGVKQGYKASSIVPRGASVLSRAKLWALVEIMVGLSGDAQDHQLEIPSTKTNIAASHGPCEGSGSELKNTTTYQSIKYNIASAPLRVRREAIRDAREALKGWAPNFGDENWGLDVLIDAKKRKR
ncbi:uncharacterized protein N7483_010908 [Penicillium malachiteum]|uniref:uncharacterized protein n=1 Tax=Penicillium malachiteum TaxID=1324776 RepID=UPI0025474774|nr:uncharacterized protein N7483_010908 [Penicillium malachiteum]KAJ5713727.1 hypothetical protein N7483_010908 [Penicillium malachiteum]